MHEYYLYFSYGLMLHPCPRDAGGPASPPAARGASHVYVRHSAQRRGLVRFLILPHHAACSRLPAAALSWLKPADCAVRAQSAVGRRARPPETTR